MPIKTIDEYIQTFPKDIQTILQKIRKLIHDTMPHLEEAMKYGIPTFRLNNTNLVHFAGFAKHIGFYPAPSGIVKFKAELAGYKHAKGSVQFPLDKPIPYGIIKQITIFRASEVLDNK